jgi:hypothetical protein
MSVCCQSFTLTQNISWGLLLCLAPPTQQTVNQPHYVEISSQGVMSSKKGKTTVDCVLLKDRIMRKKEDVFQLVKKTKLLTNYISKYRISGRNQQYDVTISKQKEICEGSVMKYFDTDRLSRILLQNWGRTGVRPPLPRLDLNQTHVLCCNTSQGTAWYSGKSVHLYLQWATFVQISEGFM